MEGLIIEPSQDTPQVVFDPTSNIFKLTQRSYPEDAYEFYEPVLKWFQQYSASPNNEMTFEFKLDYFNTASGKQLFKLLLMLEQIAAKSEVKIVWKYKGSDKEMKTHGEIFSSVVNVDFDVIETND